MRLLFQPLFTCIELPAAWSSKILPCNLLRISVLSRTSCFNSRLAFFCYYHTPPSDRLCFCYTQLIHRQEQLLTLSKCQLLLKCPCIALPVAWCFSHSQILFLLPALPTTCLVTLFDSQFWWIQTSCCPSKAFFSFCFTLTLGSMLEAPSTLIIPSTIPRSAS